MFQTVLNFRRLSEENISVAEQHQVKSVSQSVRELWAVSVSKLDLEIRHK